MDHVKKKHQTKSKWVKDIAFRKIVPKSPPSMILRRTLRDSAKEIREN
jgi:hypothetical protein